MFNTLSRTALWLLGAEACGFARDARSRSGRQLRPWEFVAKAPGARVGSDRLAPAKSAWFEPGVYGAAETADIINRDAIGCRAKVTDDGRVEVEEV